MSLLSKISTIISEMVPILSNVSNSVRGSVYGSHRAFSEDIKIDITNQQHRDLPVELEENPFVKKKPECLLCKLKIHPNYKNVRLLSQFQSRYTGRIYGRHITGLCVRKQKSIENEIRKAQACGLMPFMTKQIEYVNDPKLFDADYPFRPHKYQ